jgi:hypothetical protein
MLYKSLGFAVSDGELLLEEPLKGASDTEGSEQDCILHDGLTFV